MSNKQLEHAIRRAVERVRRCAVEGTIEAVVVSLEDEEYQIIVLRRSSRDTVGGDRLPRRENGDSEFDRPWKQFFIDGLRRGASVTEAAELAGVTRRHAHRCWGNDEKFHDAWEKAKMSRKKAKMSQV